METILVAFTQLLNNYFVKESRRFSPETNRKWIMFSLYEVFGVDKLMKTLQIFLSALFGRRYHNFSSDVILLTTGINAVDEVFGVLSRKCDSNSEFCQLFRSINIFRVNRYEPL